MYAVDGLAVATRVAVDWAIHEAKLAQDPYTSRLYLKRGRAPKEGERFAIRELAQTLRTIARNGREGFYDGPVADDMVAYLRSLGGTHTLEDFAAQRAEYVTQIETAYRGSRILKIPPNGHGDRTRRV